MKHKYFFILFLLFSSFSFSQIINIPDANFKARLLEMRNLNINRDNEIQKSEAIAFTGYINCSDLGITDLTGIEEFINLTELVCSNNSLTALDLSKNKALKLLFCFNNQLTNLNISQSKDLYELICDNNELSDLDVTQNTELITLWCKNNQLTSIDVSKNTVLENFICDDNQITSLDLSANTQLDYVFCRNNLISTINVSKNTVLDVLYCNNNLLTNLDISKNTVLSQVWCHFNKLNSIDVTHNPELISLFCRNNQIENVDVSQNPALLNLFCENNKLNSLNMKNGNNDILYNFDSRNNPDLTCIQVDDVSIVDDKQRWNKDLTASYSENCTTLGIQDIDATSSIFTYPNPVSNQLFIAGASKLRNVNLYSLNGQLIKSSKTTKVDMSTLSQGLYILEVIFRDGKKSTKRILKG